MAIDKNTATIGFEKKIWDAACVLRGHMTASDYQKVVLGLIFLKYINDQFEKKYKELVDEGDGFENDSDEYVSEGIFYVPEEARWAVIAADATTPNIGITIDNAMTAIEKDNEEMLKGILPKIYASPDLDKRRLGEVVLLFTNLELHEEDGSRDLLGRTYEYCLQQFAAEQGQRGGEFYTPSCVVRTIVEILQPYKGRVYDPCCGAGGMFVQSLKFLDAHHGNRNEFTVYGQEANPETWKLAKMNLAIRGIHAQLGKHADDTFFNDLHPSMRADFIMANPPFNLSNWGASKLGEDPRFCYGLPPEGNANFAWLQHMIYHLAPEGRLAMVMANGAVSSCSGGEDKIRKAIVDADLVEGIVAMPDKLFYSVSIPVTIWVLNRKKSQKGKILFVDARNMGVMIDRKHRELTDAAMPQWADKKEEDCDIQKIAKTFDLFREGRLEDEKGFCAVKDIADMDEQCVLTPGRYVGIAEDNSDTEPYEEKMQRLTSELSTLFAESKEQEEEIRKQLKSIGWEV